MIRKHAIWAAAVAGALGTMALTTLAGGEGNTTTKADMMSTAKTDIGMLGRFIALEPAPEAALWDTTELPGGADWMLTGLLTYTAADRATLMGQMSAQPGQFAFAAPAWLPEEAALALEVSENTITSEQTLTPAPFLKSPLLNGNALPVGETQLFIVLQTQ